MSGAAARAVPLRMPAGPAAAPSQAPVTERLLRLVPQRRSKASRTPFALVLVVLLLGGLLGLLLLNTLVAQDSFTLHDLAKQGRELQLREQQLAGQVEAAQAPAALADRATRLGLVPGGAPAFLRLSDGRVLGKAAAAKAQVAPAPPKPTTAASAAPTAAGTSAGRTPTAPQGSTTWTTPRQSPPPGTGGHR